MDDVIIGRIAQETALPENTVSATVSLLEKGATGPFIVRYRKEATGGLDEAKVRLVQERMDYYREIRDKRTALLKSLSEQNKLTEEIRNRIENTLSKVELEDLQQKYRARKKNRAMEAIAKGLEPLAEYFWNQEPDAWSMEEHIQVFVDASRELSTAEDALQGTVDIIAEWISENIEYRHALREMLEKDGFLISKVVPAKVNQKTKYNMYYERRESVTTIPSHRVLAIRRGCKEGILISSIEGDHSKSQEFLLASVIKERESLFTPVLEAAVRESYNRILKPLIETEVRTQLKERADREAIRVFQENLSNLLLSPPAGPMVVMGIDWGKDEECSVAVVDGTGTFLEGSKVRFTPSAKARHNGNKPASSGDKGSKTTNGSGKNPASGEPPAAVETAPVPEPNTIVDGPAEDTPENAAPATVPSDPADNPAPVATETLPESPQTAEADLQEPATVEQSAEAESMEGQSEEPKPVETRPAETPQVPSAETESAVLNSGPQTAEPERATTESGEEKTAAPFTPDPQAAEGPETEPDPVSATLTEVASVQPLSASPDKESLPTETEPGHSTGIEFEAARRTLKDLITKHKVQALSIAAGPKARELESSLRKILTEENLAEVIIAAVNDAGIAIYSSSRVAREEFQDWSPSARCAVSLARRLQDPLSELVKIDPKLIGVGQYQHDVDQKELHRKLLRTVQFCVNKVGVNVNTATESLLRYVSGLNEKTARRITTYRKNQGPFASREAIAGAVGLDAVAYQQAAAFLRIPDGENPLDRTAVHPESYPIVEKMASTLEVTVKDLVGNREKIASLKLEDFLSDTAGIPTLKDIREELLRPGRDPRKTFKLPKFRDDVTSMADLQTGMAMEGIVTNVTNFGAFVDIGVRQDGLVHLSQMSNRFIRDPREAVKVGDIVRVQVISVENETKRIGLSMKALLPAVPRKRRKQQRPQSGKANPSGRKTGGTAESGKAGAEETTAKAPQDKTGTARRRPKPNRPRGNPAQTRKRSESIPEKADESGQKKESAPEGPEPSLQEKIAILQSKFRRIN